MSGMVIRPLEENNQGGEMSDIDQMIRLMRDIDDSKRKRRLDGSPYTKPSREARKEKNRRQRKAKKRK